MRAMDRPVGEIRYREVYGPLRPIRRIVEERLATAALPMSTPVELHAPERVTTIEGECAAIVRLDLLVSDAVIQRAAPPGPPDRPAVRMFGVVFADHFTTLIDGICLQREHVDEFVSTVRGLTRNTSLVLGARRRRFVYRRPPGWQALATPFTTRYVPPDYPRNLAMITVHPAMPSGPSHWYFESVVSDIREKGATVQELGDLETVTIAGLTGQRARVRSATSGRPTIHVPVLLQDKNYVYRLRFDHAPDTSEQPVFEALCASIERIPEPFTEKPVGTTFDHYID